MLRRRQNLSKYAFLPTKMSILNGIPISVHIEYILCNLGYDYPDHRNKFNYGRKFCLRVSLFKLVMCSQVNCIFGSYSTFTKASC